MLCGRKKTRKRLLAGILPLTVDNLDRAKLQYNKGGHTEEVCLLQIKWTPAKGNGKWFLPGFCDPPSIIHKVQPVNPFVYSKPHKVKGYADDLTTISSTPAEHQEVITMMDGRCMDVGLRVRPGKCYSLLFDGKDAKYIPSLS